jgi:uncharacterized protein YjbI with pentapeptide repeats
MRAHGREKGAGTFEFRGQVNMLTAKSNTVPTAQDTETPVNPYSLLDAVNASSDTAHMGWLLFLGLMTYLTIAVAGVSHKDLLLQTPVALPILQVSIQQVQFFQFAPVLLVLLHMGVVSQLVLVAKKTLEFDSAVQLLEASDRRTHPLRLELHNFFFVQAIAGPHRSRVMSMFLHGMSWLTLVVLPVVLLLFIQIRYLPFHDAAITWVHRLALVADIIVLITIGIFLLRGESSFGLAVGRTARERPISFVTTATVFLATTFFSFFVATIPGETLDRMSGTMMGKPAMAAPAKIGTAVSGGSAEAKPGFMVGFALPFLQPRSDGSLFGMFHRNLIATDLDFPGKSGETISLRGRDLRYAKLDRSNLASVDLTGADLDGASLIATDLSGAKLQCADLNELILSENRAAAVCTSARGANFSRASLKAARMSGIDMQGAKFEEAQMEGAELAYSVLTGSNFSSAHMERVDMTGGVHAEGTNFLIASLQGADLTGALLHGADFSSAAMQGVMLSHAQLYGAALRDADLEGADLNQSKLQGADLTGAKLRASDLRGASIWMAMPPTGDAVANADLTEFVVKPLEDKDLAAFDAIVERINIIRTRGLVKDAMAAISNTVTSRKWLGSPEQGRWQAMATASTPALTDAYKLRLTDYLGSLACKARWSSGHVATGIAKRAQGQQFRGDMPAIYDRIRAKDCPAADNIGKKALRDLASAVDYVRGN